LKRAELEIVLARFKEMEQIEQTLVELGKVSVSVSLKNGGLDLSKPSGILKDALHRGLTARLSELRGELRNTIDLEV
jgi:hypothetical protein